MFKTISCNASMGWGFAAGIGILGAALAACSGDDNNNNNNTDASSGSSTTGSTSGSTSGSTTGSPSGSTTGSSTTSGSSGSGSTTSSGSSSGADAGGDASDGGTKGDATTEGGEAGTVEGNAVIADQYNNRVIEVDSHGTIVWTFGDGKATPGATSVVSPNDAERLANGQTLISGTGDPSGGAQGDKACAALDAGACSDNRVLLVSQDGGIVWQYGAHGELSGPVAAVMLSSGNVLITDQGNNRIVEVTQDGGVAWQYGPNDGGSTLTGPNSAVRLANGDTLIADEGANRVVEVAADGGVVWQYGPSGDGGSTLNQPAFASRLAASGNTLISDSANNRIVEVASDGGVVWSYYTTSRSTSSTAGTVDGGNMAPTPTRGVRLANGNTLISDQFNQQVIEVTAGANPSIVYTYGQLNVAGNGANQLNAPYDAKRVGDYTWNGQ